MIKIKINLYILVFNTFNTCLTENVNLPGTPSFQTLSVLYCSQKRTLVLVRPVQRCFGSSLTVGFCLVGDHHMLSLGKDGGHGVVTIIVMMGVELSDLQPVVQFGVDGPVLSQGIRKNPDSVAFGDGVAKEVRIFSPFLVVHPIGK